MTDVLKTLPEAQEPLSNEEMNMMRDIFQYQNAGAPATNFYRPLMYGVLFFVLSLPITDKLIKGFIDTTDLILIAIKSALFILITYVLGLFGF